MIHAVAFSGGKDSTALLCWMREQGIEHETVFYDTSWEHPDTMGYVWEIAEKFLGGRLTVLKSEKYEGLKDLVVRRKMVPSMHTRFCTEELKVFPLHSWIRKQEDDVTVYQGIRADESGPRSKMSEDQYVNEAGGFQIRRPLFRWTAEQCFEIIRRHGLEPNPLYLKGAKRVGCWPCIFTSFGELKRLFQNTPGLRERLVALEMELNAGRDEFDYRSWFRVDKIPQDYCSRWVKKKDGRMIKVPTVDDVIRYIGALDDRQLGMFGETPRCMSVYNLCE
jgi:3'-phosphoadenosine 5'-phosphosulfate sulfotransferase (PAPS reductase)/FAD synthetase